jgi:Mg2+-importing ATPase
LITAVMLAQKTSHMAKQKVIVKNLASMQNFGSMDILCSDKIGTLTSGNMVLNACLDAPGNPSERTLLLVYLNSFYEIGIKSPLDTAILQYASHASQDVQAYRKSGEIPFDFERRRLSMVVEKDGSALLISNRNFASHFSHCDATVIIASNP